jgi:predicted lipid-binding transport protein (Tim44 family)
LNFDFSITFIYRSVAMKRFAIAIFAVFVGLGATVQDAEAKRLGGGQSSGVSRDSSVMKRDAVPAKPAAAPTQSAAPAAATPPSGMSRWMGPLAGLAAGIGLAALFSHLGMGEGMANMMMLLAIAAVAVFAVRWLMRKRQPAGALQPAMQYAGAPAGLEPTRPVDSFSPAQPAGNPAAGAAAAHVPAGFDVDGFLRQAKLNFIRLQAANDRGDMEDIRQFCTPVMVAEIQLQLQERNQLAQETDVMQLHAELLDVSSEGDHGIASVRFSGELREAANAAPEVFSEVWHLTKPITGDQGWRVAGIQQS